LYQDELDIMEKKKEKILLLSLRRQQAAEDQRRVKEYELQRRKDEEAAKAEEKERKKEDEKARKQAILESYRLKKQEELEPVSIFCGFYVSAIIYKFGTFRPLSNFLFGLKK
jgi:hypothetical protein